MAALRLEKNPLLRWCARFFLGNVLIFWLIGLIYWPSITWQGVLQGTDVFLLFSYLGHFSLIAFLPFLMVAALILFLPVRGLVFGFSILLATLTSSFLVVDALTYHTYQFHLNAIVLKFFIHGITQDDLGLSLLEKLSPIIILSVFLLLETFYGRWLWIRWYNRSFLNGWIKWIVIFLSLCSFVSYTMIFFTKPMMGRIFIQKARFLPLYIEILGAVLPEKERNMVLLRVNDDDPLKWITTNKPLKYPLQPLQYTFPKQPLNLVIIAIDSWRFDMLNEQVTPHLKKFAEQAWLFKNHFSGGNSTGPGIFTLFYGLPATYTTAMEAQHRGPLLLDELLSQHYQMGIFSSAPLYTPPMDRSVFQAIKNLQVEKQPGETVYIRDAIVTEKFAKFIAERDVKQPFFSFLFYDAAHSYCGPHETLGPFSPTTKNCNRLTYNKSNHARYFNRYKNALFSIDQQIKQALHALQAQQLLDNTVIIILGDHGEEFNDTESGYLGHASNYTHYQIQTPLIMYWPNEKPAVFTYKTSHFDIVPTLMQRFLGCHNSTLDYSVGANLLDNKLRPYFIISSYVDIGVVEPQRITTIFPAGNYQIAQSNGRAMPETEINLTIMQQVYDDLRRFYKT